MLAAELKCRSRMHYFLADRQARAIDPEARALLLDAQGFVTRPRRPICWSIAPARGWSRCRRAKSCTASACRWRRSLPAGRLDRRQRDLAPEDVAKADEVLLTSTSICVLPVTRFNKLPIGDGRPGRVFSRLLAAWSQSVGFDIAARRCNIALGMSPRYAQFLVFGWHVPEPAKGVVSPAATPFAALRDVPPSRSGTCHPLAQGRATLSLRDVPPSRYGTCHPF